MPPCGCTQSKGSAQHVYIDANGKQTIYPTAVQAKAAQIRAGGTGTVKPR